MGYKVNKLSLNQKRLKRLEEKWKSLLELYKDRGDYMMVIHPDGRAEKIPFEEYKLRHERRFIIKSIYDLLPEELIYIPHKGSLKILAFSDYRVHNLKRLLSFVENLSEKPDVIIYAGDDVCRFAPPPQELLVSKCQQMKSSYKYGDELIHFGCSEEFNFIWRFSKRLSTAPDDSYLRSRFSLLVEFIREISDLARNFKGGDFISSLNNVIYDKYRALNLDILINEFRYFRDLIIIGKDTELKIIKLTHDLKRDMILLDPISRKLISIKDVDSFAFKKIMEDDKFIYYYVIESNRVNNLFEELAKRSRYGLIAIVGNDGGILDRDLIYGDRVFNGHRSWVRIGKFFIVGQEGSTDGIGSFGGYLEADVKIRLELAREFAEPDAKLIVVSHTPPRGVLDRALRFGARSIGSIALRDFIEESSSMIPLVICGHVHKQGGSWDRIDNTIVVNVSSHDSIFAKANIAWITVDENGIVNVNFYKLPSPVEDIFESKPRERWLEELINFIGLSRSEAELFIEMFSKYGKSFLEDLDKLANLKFKFGFTWDNVFKLYTHGVISADQINDKIIEKVARNSRYPHNIHLRRAYINLLRERERENIYLLHPLPLGNEEKYIIVDTEYTPNNVILYGFYDPFLGEVRQFWFNEVNKVIEYVNSRRDHVFIYWGGADKKILNERLGLNIKTLNLLYYVQIALVAPIESTTLQDVHRILCGFTEDQWWQENFYDVDWVDKLYLCNVLMRNSNDSIAREKLANINRADLLALNCVINKLKNLPVKTKEETIHNNI